MIWELLRSPYLLGLDYFCGAGYGQNSQSSFFLFLQFWTVGKLILREKEYMIVSLWKL